MRSDELIQDTTTSTFTGSAIDVSQCRQFSIDLTVNSGATATFAIYGKARKAGSWVRIDGDYTLSGLTASAVVPFATPMMYARVDCTSVSGGSVAVGIVRERKS